MARVCSVCVSPMLEKVSEYTRQSIPVTAIANSTGLSESALRRHLANHVHGGALRDARFNSGEPTGDLVKRLVEALDDVSAVRSAALMSGQSGLVLRSATAGASMISTLVGALGVKSADVAEQLRTSELLQLAMARAMTRHPEFAPVFAQELRKLDLPTFAEDIESNFAPDEPGMTLEQLHTDGEDPE